MKHRIVIGIFVLLAGIPAMVVWGQHENNNLQAGLAALQRKDPARAVSVFSTIIQGHPKDVKAYLLRGEAYFLSGDYPKALVDFYEANRHKPGYASLWIARTYAQTGDTDKAFRALKDHLRSPSRRPEREIKLDTLLLPLENTPSWRALWKTEWYNQKDKGISAIRFDVARGDLNTALQEVNRLLAQYNNDPRLLALRGTIYNAENEQRKAQQDIVKALSLQPEDTVALYAMAKLDLTMGKYAAVAAVLDKLYRITPEHFSLLLKISDAWSRAGRYDQSEKYLQEYVKYFPEDIGAVFRAGELSGKMNHYRDALHYFSVVIEKDPSKPIYFVARADMYVKAHTYRYAIDDYAMALDLDPTNGDVYFRRGQVYLKLGDKKNACFDFHQALHYGKKEAVPFLQKYCAY